MLGVSVIATLPLSAEAGSGFFLRSQSSTTLGSAQAGMTASAQDISLLAFNPAVLSYHPGTQIAGGTTGIITSGTSDIDAATTILGTPIGGAPGGDSGKAVAVPSFYASHQVGSDVTVGIGVTSFFGLGSEWDDEWEGRYHAINSDLVTISINPVVAYRILPNLTIGAGLQAQYAKTNLTAALDFGTIDAVLLNGLNGGVPAQDDGFLEVDADDWAFGGTAGILYEPVKGTRVGLAYRSQVTHDLSGDARYVLGGPVGAGVAAATGAFRPSQAFTDLPLPDTVTLGAYHEFNDKWAVMADVMWMNWSRQEQFLLTSDNPAQPDQAVEQDWNDSIFAAIGAIYRPTETVALRAGFAYDQSPVPNRTRSPIIADEDSYWVGVGAEFRITPKMKLDFNLGHIFTSQSTLNLSATSEGNTFRGDLDGRVEGIRTLFFGVQFNYVL